MSFLELAPPIMSFPSFLGASGPWLPSVSTPLFLLGVGMLSGLVLLALLVLLMQVISKIPGVAAVVGSNQNANVLGGILTAAIAGVAMYFSMSEFSSGADGDVNEQIPVGVTIVMLSAIVGFSLVYGIRQRAAKEAWQTLTEGVAGYLGLFVLIIGGIGLITIPVASNPMQAITSIPSLFTTGEKTESFTLPGLKEDQDVEEAAFVPVDLAYDLRYLSEVTIVSDRTIVIGDSDNSADFRMNQVRLAPKEPLKWFRTSGNPPPLSLDPDRLIHIQNREFDPAQVTFTLVTLPTVPEASTLLIGAAAVLMFGLLLLLQQSAAPRMTAIALSTAKSELASPLFLFLMIMGAVLIFLLVIIPFHTFGEDIKLLKDNGITIIMLLAVFEGIWAASSSVSEEIEGRTALTVLSKPIGRRTFVIGKFMGIFWVILLMFLVLGFLELAAVAYKPIHEARESSLETPTWQACNLEMVRTIPGLAMAMMEAIVLSAISVALATRLPQLANFAVCFAIYIVGHLTSTLVGSSEGNFEIVRFVAQLIATVIPILENFSMQAAIDAGNPITFSVLSADLVYCGLYTLLAMFLALLLFEDRDLA